MGRSATLRGVVTIGFLHTSAVHLQTFERLAAQIAPGVPIVWAVDEELLALARHHGVEHQLITDGIGRALERLEHEGAEIVVCTCSTIGGVAEAIGHQRGQAVVRVDRPMAERAVGIGGRVCVVAALDSTLAPTRELIEGVASARGVELGIEAYVVAGAWERFEAGDHEGYLEVLAAALPGIAADADVVVLAQASMAGAADRVDVGVPVLSSPRLAVEALFG